MLVLALLACRPGASLPELPPADSGLPACVVADASAAPIGPVPGELFYAQLGLSGLSLGEAAIVVGPDGRTVLIDVGNDSHDRQVRDALDRIDGMRVEAGFPARPPREVDHVVLTHFHADHADGLGDLLGDVRLTGGVVHRGLVDLTAAANTNTIGKACEVLAALPSFPLCEGAPLADCRPQSWADTRPAAACAGLNAGELGGAGPAGPAWLSLGGGARMSFLAANGWIGGASFAAEVGPLRTNDGNGENARSVVGLLSHGDFRLLFAGDLTGASPDSDDVEAFFAARLAGVSDLDARGVDVLHLSHHGRDSSNTGPWLDALVPGDGGARNAVIGVSDAHLGSPHLSVLEGVLGGQRLGAGGVWTTTIARGGAEAAGLVSARGGWIGVRTTGGGAGYVIQAVGADGAVLAGRSFGAVRGCTPADP